MMKTATFLFLMILCAALVFAQQQPQTAPVPAGQHDETAKAVQAKIEGQDKVKIDGLNVLHNDGVITLEGVADVYGSYYTAENIARKFKGVTRVDNQIMVRNKKVPDQDIQIAIIQKIQPRLRPEPFDLVSVKVQNGFVTLTGNVVDQTLVDEAFRAAMWVPGVINVDNKIELASNSANDARLRVGIYRMLAAEFPLYFRSAHPSVIILANHGRVTLVGNVNNKGDKARMVSRVRSLVGVVSIEDQLSVPE